MIDDDDDIQSNNQKLMIKIIKMNKKTITLIAIILITITINQLQILKTKKTLKARDTFTRHFIVEREIPF